MCADRAVCEPKSDPGGRGERHLLPHGHGEDSSGVGTQHAAVVGVPFTLAHPVFDEGQEVGGEEASPLIG